MDEIYLSFFACRPSTVLAIERCCQIMQRSYLPDDHARSTIRVRYAQRYRRQIADWNCAIDTASSTFRRSYKRRQTVSSCFSWRQQVSSDKILSALCAWCIYTPLIVMYNLGWGETRTYRLTATVSYCNKQYTACCNVHVYMCMCAWYTGWGTTCKMGVWRQPSYMLND